MTLLEIDDFEKRATAIIKKETVKFTQDDQKIVVRFCLESCFYSKLHVLFTEIKLLKLTEDIFSSLIIRDFVLDLTDKLSVGLMLGACNDWKIEKYLAKAISHYPSREAVKEEQTLAPIRVLDNICVYQDEIENVLISNKWLVSIVLINLYFFENEEIPQPDRQ